jgi:hypothetical protein
MSLGGALYADALFKQKCEAHIEKLEGYPRATLDYLSTLEWPTYGPGD